MRLTTAEDDWRVTPSNASLAAKTAGRHVVPRVIQVVLSLSPGGTERLVIELVQRLARSVEMSVCCLDERGTWAADVTNAGVTVSCLDRRPGFRPSVAYRLARILGEQKIDVVHCHHYSSFVYGRLAAALRPGVRVVFTEHGRLSDAGPSRKRRLVNPWLARLPFQMFAVSADLRRHMSAEGFPPDKIQVIYNGVDPGRLVNAPEREAARRDLGVRPGSVAFGTVGRLDSVKDLATMINAFARFQRTAGMPSQLVVVGDGPEGTSLKDLVGRLGLQEAVVFSGYRADVRRLFPAFDVYVNSSIHEGVSLTILEAMAASRAVIATRVGGNPEVVIDGETGVLVPARDVDALAAALSDLAGVPARCMALGEAGRTRVLEHFTIDRMVAQYLAAYKKSAH